MKGKMFSHLMSVLLIAVLTMSVLSVCAAADGPYCASCAANGQECTGFYATTSFTKISETQCARLYVCNNGHAQLMHNADGSFKDASAHAAVKNATCESAAVCGNCNSTFGAPLEHEVVIDKAVAATCATKGLTEGKHCGVCGKVLVEQEETLTIDHTFDDGKVTKPTCSSEGYTTYTCKVCGYKLITDKVKPLSHWYDLWEPTGDGRNSAPCKRDNCTYVKTTDCVDWEFALVPAGSDQAEGFSICPVCGELSDGGRLELVEGARVKAITGGVPAGDMVLRCGELENGEKVMCVAFEFDARLVGCTGWTEFTVPAELLEGYQLMLLDNEGGETEVEVETSVNKATFTLSFYGDAQGHRTPVRMLHLVPLEPEVTEEEVAETAETVDAEETVETDETGETAETEEAAGK